MKLLDKAFANLQFDEPEYQCPNKLATRLSFHYLKLQAAYNVQLMNDTKVRIGLKPK